MVKENFCFKKVYIGSDHAGFEAKMQILGILKELDMEFVDVGPFTGEKSVDYPKYALDVGKKVVKNLGSCGILICGSGTGMQIAANKVKGVRAAFSYDKYSSKMARLDNDANILTLRGRDFDTSLYKIIVKTFLITQFSGLDRHKKRIEMLNDIESM